MEINSDVHIKKIEILSRLLKDSLISKKEALLLLSDEEKHSNDKLEEFKQSLKAEQYANAYFNLYTTIPSSTTSSYTINNIPIKY